eukprot:TRINITY_DN5944_c0_g1_i1.p2 TRINITY_DN5944_c0_g1~~TRINITY_DN5944_c0_g1_i1.p2  ORF type:complete len:299 (+),score=123.17 TRINITY_DN5944_c0_g1_i1:94-990(+)
MMIFKAAVFMMFFAAANSQHDELDSTPFDADLTVTWCTSNDRCTTLDNDATCVNNQCSCSSSFTGLFCGIDLSPNAPAPTPLQRLIFFLHLVESVVCTIANALLIETQVKESLASKGLANAIVKILCGSMSIGVDVEVARADEATGLANVTSSMRDAVTAYPNVTGVTDGSALVIDVNPANGDDATTTGCATNAVSTVTTQDGRCLVFECATGYTIYTYTQADNKQTSNCVLTTASPRTVESDDDLSDAEIGGIVLGVVLFVVIIGALVYFALAPKNNDIHEGGKNEPYTEENKNIVV